MYLSSDSQEGRSATFLAEDENQRKSKLKNTGHYYSVLPPNSGL